MKSLYSLLGEHYPDFAQRSVEKADSKPPHERSVHRNSQFGQQWRPIPAVLRTRLLGLVEGFERATRGAGKQGLLKLSGVAVFRALLFQFLDPRSGRCDPSYETLAERAGVGRTTAYKALARLEQVGVIERTRRLVWVPLVLNGRVIGRKAQQTSNAYRLGPPRRVGLFGAAVPAEMAEAWDKWMRSWQAFMADLADFFAKSSEFTFGTESTPIVLSNAFRPENSGLQSALDRLGEAIKGNRSPPIGRTT